MAEEIEKNPAQWALDLYESFPNLYYSSPLIYFPAFLGAVAGSGINIAYNVITRKPRYAGIHKTIFLTISTAGLLHFVAYMFRVRQVRKDTMICDYIRKHPERFPEPENKKYADIFQPWNPAR